MINVPEASVCVFTAVDETVLVLNKYRVEALMEHGHGVVEALTVLYELAEEYEPLRGTTVVLTTQTWSEDSQLAPRTSGPLGAPVGIDMDPVSRSSGGRTVIVSTSAVTVLR